MTIYVIQISSFLFLLCLVQRDTLTHFLEENENSKYYGHIFFYNQKKVYFKNMDCLELSPF